jgi:hypothetical protein
MSPRSTTAWMPLLVGDLRHTQVSKIDSRTAGRLLRCGISPSACRDKDAFSMRDGAEQLFIK